MMAKFDLAKTAEVAQLCSVPREQRNDVWRRQFHVAIPEASMRTQTPQVLVGPDGFPYFVLLLPQPGVGFETFCLSHILDFCLDNGVGIVVNPDKGQPDYVFPYGALWAFRSRGVFEPEMPVDAPRGFAPETLPEGRQVLVGQPSEDYFPANARRVVSRFLRERLGIAQPACFLLMDGASKPEQSLVFNIHPTNFANEPDFARALQALRWYLPNDYGCTAFGRESELTRAFEALPV